MSVTYEVRTHKGQGMSLSGKPGIRDTVEFKVVAVEGIDGCNERTVFCTDTWFVDGATKRQLAGLRLQALNARKRYADYFARTGRRWEQEEDVLKGGQKFQRTVDEHVLYGARHVAEHAVLFLRGVCLFPEERRREILAKGLEHALAKVTEKRKTSPTHYRQVDAYAASISTTLEAEIEKRFSLHNPEN